jgi:hypothetical protein
MICYNPCWSRITIVIFSLLGLALNSGLEAKTSPKPKELSIYYLTEWNLSDLSRAAHFLKLKNTKGNKNDLFLVFGDMFKASPSTALFDGQAEVAILGAAGVDAVYLTEGLFLLGIKSARAVIDSARFHFLGVNVKNDSNQSFTAGYLIKNFGSLRLALVGIVPDSFSQTKRLQGIRYENPDNALKRIIPLLRFRADLIGVMGMQTKTADFNWDLKELGKLPAHSLGRIRLIAKGKKWEERREVFNLESSQAEDEAVQEINAAYERKSDSLLGAPLPQTKPADSLAEKAVIAEGGVDGVVFPSGFIPAGIGTTRQLFELVAPLGHLAIFELTGSDLRGRKMKEPADANKVYRIATTLNAVTSDPLFQDKKFELSDKSLARMILDYQHHEAH